MDFMFEWQEQYITSERSERVRLVLQELMHVLGVVFVRRSKVPRLIYIMRWME
jgi:hypothetical protein